MKELTIQEKAKAYDKAVEKIKYVMEHGVSPVLNKEDLQDIFPQLKESEDERIRKALIMAINNICNGDEGLVTFNGFSKEQVLAWLKKQGEIDGSIKWHSVLKEPEEMRELLCEWDSDDSTWHEVAFYHSGNKTFWNGERQVENVTKWCYIDELFEKQGEQKFNCDKLETFVKEWRDRYSYPDDIDKFIGFAESVIKWYQQNEQKSTEEYNIRSIGSKHAQGKLAEMIKNLNPVNEILEQKPAWSEEDIKMIGTLVAIFEVNYPDGFYKVNPIGTTNMQGIHSSEIIKWFKSLKDRVQPHNSYNPYKEAVESIAEMCKHYDKASHSGLRDFYDNVKVKCKDAKEYDFLYPQNTWKPSDVQMRILSIYADQNNTHGAVLTSLYQDLKKLKEK